MAELLVASAENAGASVCDGVFSVAERVRELLTERRFLSLETDAVHVHLVHDRGVHEDGAGVHDADELCAHACVYEAQQVDQLAAT